MVRIIMTLLGIAVSALGLWMTVIWWDTVKIVLLGLAALLVLLFGLTITVFGISEIIGARSVQKPPVEP